MDSSVEIRKHGRSATIGYAEGTKNAHDFYAELGGGDTLCIISAPSPEEWPRLLPWAADRRELILERIAREVVRQENPGSTFVVHLGGVDILMPRE
jgi:hypothetical protein